VTAFPSSASISAEFNGKPISAFYLARAEANRSCLSYDVIAARIIEELPARPR
jgi:hypothetical protein